MRRNRRSLHIRRPTLAATPEGAPRTQSDDFIVVASPDPSGTPCPYFFIGSARDPNATGTTDYSKPAIQYYPLFSGGTVPTSPLPISGGVAPTPTPPTISSQIASQQVGSTTVNYPKLFPSPAPHANWQKTIQTQWQYVSGPTPGPNPAANPVCRPLYVFDEDLGAYVDANVAGNTNTGGLHTRALGYNPNEVGLFTLFKSSLSTDDGSTYATSLVNKHPFLFTRLTTRLGTTTNSADDTVCLGPLTAGLKTDSEQIIIPTGLGYKSEGQAKTNLNSITLKQSQRLRSNSDFNRDLTKPSQFCIEKTRCVNRRL